VEDALVTADAVIFATSAPEPLLGSDGIERILRSRDGNELVLVDLGLPRNVDPSVAGVESEPGRFELFDIARLDLEAFTDIGGREAQLGAAADIAVTEAERCVAWFRSKPADAIVAAIQAQAAGIAEQELAYAARRLPGLDERQQRAVEQVIRRTARKLVHMPTVRAKEACSRGDDALLEAAGWLFGIDGGLDEHTRREGAVE
jgi:glutamyl-tRNA reductase